MRYPKPAKGSATEARREKKRKLDQYRKLVNKFCLAADGYVCRRTGCGRPASHAHHVERRGRNIESPRENPNQRLSLCNWCHDAYEARGTITKKEMVADLERAVAKRQLGFEEWLRKNGPEFAALLFGGKADEDSSL